MRATVSPPTHLRHSLKSFILNHMDITATINHFLESLNLSGWASEFSFEWPFTLPSTAQGFATADAGLWVEWLSMVGFSLIYPIGLTALFFGVILIRKKHLWQALLAAPLLALCVMGAAGGLTRTSAPLPKPGMQRIAHLNAFVLSDILSPKVFFLTRSNAEVASVVEANQQLLGKLAQYRTTFPYQLALKQHAHVKSPKRHLHMVLLSKYPTERIKVWNDQAILYRIDAPRPYYLLQLHPPSAGEPLRLANRNRIWTMLTEAQLPTDKPLVVVGDANTTPWDGVYETFLKRHLLTFAGPYAPTFPSWAPLLPLDHVALTAGIGHTIRRVRVPNTDHLGLLLDISFADAATFSATQHLAH